MNNDIKLRTIISVHNLNSNHDEDYIRHALQEANVPAEDIEAVIVLVNQDNVTSTSKRDGLHKIFRTDESLAPSEVSALLGIDVTVDKLQIRAHRRKESSVWQSISIVAAAVVLAAGGLMYSMYLNQTGPFHPTISAFSR